MSEKVEFNGFTKKTLPFLKALGFHQNREWFHENKALYYSEVKEPMGDLIETVSERFEEQGIPLQGSRKTSLYRVNRDVRFARNKDPYNTHGSAMLSRNGTKKENGFVYVHFSNERVFIASGFYGMQGETMRAFRDLIIREGKKVIRLVEDLEANGYPLEFSDSLKRNPRGFETIEDERLQKLIRLKHFTFIEELDSKILQSPELADRMVVLGQKSLPFLNFGWRALDSVRDDGEN